RSEGKLAEAMAEFQRAVLMDPSVEVGLEEIKRTQQMLTQPPGQATLTPAEQARQDAADRVASIQGIPTLEPPVRTIPPLKMNNQPMNILYNTVAGIAGVTVVWDSTWNRPTRTFDVDMP